MEQLLTLKLTSALESLLDLSQLVWTFCKLTQMEPTGVLSQGVDELEDE